MLIDQAVTKARHKATHRQTATWAESFKDTLNESKVVR